jgi:putative phage-type endonuclease
MTAEIIALKQGSTEWLQARVGFITASRIGDMMAKTKTGWGASRINYRAELIYERLTGKVWPQTYQNAAMQWGTMCEPEARSMYAFLCDVDPQQVGFCPHPTIPLTGASPDGLIGEDGLIEIKCPQPATHLDTLERGEASIELDYRYQMQWQMACTDRQWCDWCSFDPRWPVEMQMFIYRLPRNAEMIAMLETEVKAFSAEVNEKVRLHKEKYKL